jgi:hypothetical protein
MLDRLKIFSARHVTFVCYRANEEKTVKGYDRNFFFIFRIRLTELRRKETDDCTYNFHTVLNETVGTCVCPRI